MRWGGALVALFVFLAVCLLVVAVRVDTLVLRARAALAHQASLDVSAERDRFVRGIFLLERRDELSARGSHLRRQRERER